MKASSKKNLLEAYLIDLLGLGQGYDAAQVGTTCQICSKNHDCQIKKDKQGLKEFI